MKNLTIEVEITNDNQFGKYKITSFVDGKNPSREYAKDKEDIQDTINQIIEEEIK